MIIAAYYRDIAVRLLETLLPSLFNCFVTLQACLFVKCLVARL